MPWWAILLCIVFAPILLVVIPTLLIVVLALYVVSTICLHILIWSLWCSRGRDILFVYSDSPIWHDYIEERILPHLGKRAVVLNWSQRKRWRLSLARMAFYHFGSYRQFNPLGIVFRRFRRTRTFRFWQPFRDFKHGHPEALHKIESEFFGFIGVQRHD
jgi:hypothetical protein